MAHDGEYSAVALDSPSLTNSETSTTDSINFNTINVAYLNIRGQTGLDITKQIQIEKFMKAFKIDILNCQEINIT